MMRGEEVKISKLELRDWVSDECDIHGGRDFDRDPGLQTRLQTRYRERKFEVVEVSLAL